MRPETVHIGSRGECLAHLTRRFELVEQYHHGIEHVVEHDASDAAGFNSKGAAAIDFHNDAYDYPAMPTHIALYCEHADCEGGNTFFAEFSPALRSLRPHQQSLLRDRRMRFFTEPAAHYARTDLGVESPVVAADTLRYSYGYLRPRSAQHAPFVAALDALNEALHGHKREVSLRPGDLLVLDNIVYVHGRTAFRGRRRLVRYWMKAA